jgi:hypothetical protein
MLERQIAPGDDDDAAARSSHAHQLVHKLLLVGHVFAALHGPCQVKLACHARPKSARGTCTGCVEANATARNIISMVECPPSEKGICSASATWNDTRWSSPCSAVSALARAACKRMAHRQNQPGWPPPTIRVMAVRPPHRAAPQLLHGLGACTWTGLRVMPLPELPYFAAMCRLLPPMPQPTSTVCIGQQTV